jgi:hypothetical protein
MNGWIGIDGAKLNSGNWTEKRACASALVLLGLGIWVWIAFSTNRALGGACTVLYKLLCLAALPSAEWLEIKYHIFQDHSSASFGIVKFSCREQGFEPGLNRVQVFEHCASISISIE